MGFVSAMIFGIGMIGPHTPSYGQPSLIARLVFSLLTVLLTFDGLVVARPGPAKIALLAEGIWILLVTIDLLHVRRIF